MGIITSVEKNLPDHESLTLQMSGRDSMGDIQYILGHEMNAVTFDFRLTPVIKFTAIAFVENKERAHRPVTDLREAMTLFESALRQHYGAGIQATNARDTYFLDVKLDPIMWPNSADFAERLRHWLRVVNIVMVAKYSWPG